MEESFKKEVTKRSLVYGLLLGIIYIILTTVVNMFLVTSVMSFNGLKLLIYILYFVCMAILVKQMRKDAGGFIDFKVVFRSLFIMIIISELLFVIYIHLYYMYIDPDFMSTLMENTLAFMKKTNSGEERINSAMKQFDTQMKQMQEFSVKAFIMNYFTWIIVDSIIALIMAAIIKKKKPLDITE